MLDDFWKTHALVNYMLNTVRQGISNVVWVSYVTTGGKSASLSWNKAAIWGLRPDFYYCQTIAGLLMGRSPWREDGSVVYNCCWPSPAQSFSDPSPVGLMIVFYCLRFETSLFVASYVVIMQPLKIIRTFSQHSTSAGQRKPSILYSQQKNYETFHRLQFRHLRKFLQTYWLTKTVHGYSYSFNNSWELSDPPLV
jgi:hypothetical protein